MLSAIMMSGLFILGGWMINLDASGALIHILVPTSAEAGISGPGGGDRSGDEPADIDDMSFPDVRMIDQHGRTIRTLKDWLNRKRDNRRPDEFIHDEN